MLNRMTYRTIISNLYHEAYANEAEKVLRLFDSDKTLGRIGALDNPSQSLQELIAWHERTQTESFEHVSEQTIRNAVGKWIKKNFNRHYILQHLGKKRGQESSDELKENLQYIDENHMFSGLDLTGEFNTINQEHSLRLQEEEIRYAQNRRRGQWDNTTDARLAQLYERTHE